MKGGKNCNKIEGRYCKIQIKEENLLKLLNE